MINGDSLKRLAQAQNPSKECAQQAKNRMMSRISSPLLSSLSQRTKPSATLRRTIKERIFGRIALPSSVHVFPALKDAFSLSSAKTMQLRERILSHLVPLRVSPFGEGLKWTAAMAVFVLLIRMMPFVFLTSTTQAGSKVELLPMYGDVSVTVAGISRSLDEAYVLVGPALIQTGDGEATIVLHDDGVVRLAPYSTIRIHDLTNRPQPTSGPTLSFVRGQVWVQGLLPPTVAPIIVALPDNELVMLNEGSISIVAGATLSVSVFDKRAIVKRGDREQFLVAGERSVLHKRVPLTAQKFRSSQFQAEWSLQNLARDAVHRDEIALLHSEYRGQAAGILPTSILYSAKRIAEEVDVLFTVGSDARVQKRLQQADTRLSEALALIEEGDSAEANVQLLAYRETLLTLASGTGDNLVKFLLNKQITEAATTLSTLTPEDEAYALKEAVYDVIAAVPDTNLASQNIEGYVLVDKLASLNRVLANSGSISEAVALYDDIHPYLSGILSDEKAVHSILKKEAESLLVSLSESLRALEEDGVESTVLVTMREEIAKYLPAEKYEQIRTSEEGLNLIVQGMVGRIFNLKMSRSRYNQLVLEMRLIVDHPDRGRILRRLYHALPENGLARYAGGEIQKLRDELIY